MTVEEWAQAQWFVGRQGAGALGSTGPRTSACWAMADDPCRFPGSPNDYLVSAAIRRATRRGYEVRLSGLSCGEGKNAMTKREADTCTDERVAYNEAKELK